MDDPPLGSAHRLELDRPPKAQSVVRGLIGGPPKRRFAALAIASRINHHHLPIAEATERSARSEVLQRVNRRAMLADQQPEILAADDRTDLLVALAHLDGRRQAKGASNALDHLPDTLCRGI